MTYDMFMVRIRRSASALPKELPPSRFDRYGEQDAARRRVELRKVLRLMYPGTDFTGRDEPTLLALLEAAYANPGGIDA